MPMSPAAMLEAIERNLPARTGRSLAEWAKLVKAKGPKGTKERAAWLHSEHGLGGPTALVIASRAEGSKPLAEYDDGEALLNAMFAGPKAGLRPVYVAARRAIMALGKDVVGSARKTYEAFSRRRQFAVLQPSTKDRLDLGLVLPNVEATGRLRATTQVGGGRVTHAIALTTAKDVDAEVRRWLRAAYQQDA
jgi:predicted transport protein